MKLGRIAFGRDGVRVLPSASAVRERELTMQRDAARLMVIGLAAEVTKGQRRVSRDVDRLLAKYEPIVREWDEGGVR